MSETHLPAQPNQEDDAIPLGNLARVGVAWTTAAALASRAIQLLLNIVLAWFLALEDFGLVAIAGSIVSFIIMFRHGGVGQVLLQQRDYQIYRRSAQIAVMGLGSFVGLTILCLGVGAAHFYAEPKLFWILGLIGLSMPLESMKIIPETDLTRLMQYRRLAMIRVAELLVVLVFSVILAALGAGVYSLVLPRILTAPLTVLMLKAAGPPIESADGPSSVHVRFLLANGTLVASATLASQVIGQIDYLLLGKHVEVDEVGIYFMAFSLANQSVMVIAGNVAAVLRPLLAQLSNQTHRRADIFQRSLLLVIAIAAPLCGLVAVAADSFLGILFDPRWTACAPILATLSIAMPLALITQLAGPYFEARHKWREWTSFMWLAAILHSALMLVVTPYGIDTTAKASAVSLALIGLAACCIAMRHDARRLGRTLNGIFAIAACALVAGLVADYATRNAQAGRHLLKLSTQAAIFIPVYSFLMYVGARQLCDDAIHQAQQMRDLIFRRSEQRLRVKS